VTKWGCYRMKEKISVLNFDTSLISKQDFRQEVESFCKEGKLKSILFLSVPILEEAMASEEYYEKVKRFQFIYPGNEDVLLMHPVEEYKQKGLMMGEGYLEEILEYIEKSEKTLYLVGDSYDKLQAFISYCQQKYSQIKLVGSFVGGEQMDDAILLNDINVTCPDVILTAIAPQLQENWIQDNLDKLNGKVLIGADVLVKKVIADQVEQYERETHGALFNGCVRIKERIARHFIHKMFRASYESFMRLQEEKLGKRRFFVKENKQ